MVRAAALILLLAGCSQAEPSEPGAYDEVVAQIASEKRASPAPEATPIAYPAPTPRSIYTGPSLAEIEQFNAQQERDRTDARIRRLEDAQINGAH